jgi:hypothetical protein
MGSCQTDAFSILNIYGRNNTARVPSVGIFWGIHDRSANHLVLINDNVALEAAERYGDFLTYPHGHFELWEFVRTRDETELRRLGLPAWLSGAEYEAFPRGRVVCEATTYEFTIYADRRLQTRHTLNVILQAFALAHQTWCLRSDEHYT